MNAKLTLKIIGGVLTTIILGAIGSGVWEIILSPALSYLGNLITSSLSLISNSYENSLYQQAANFEGLSVEYLTWFITVALMIFLFSYSIGTLSSPEFKNVFLSPLKGVKGTIFTGSFLVFSMFNYATHFSVLKVRTYTIQNIEILRPHIGEQEYHLMRSEFFRIKGKDDFNTILKKIYDTAEVKKIPISKFEGL